MQVGQAKKEAPQTIKGSGEGEGPLGGALPFTNQKFLDLMRFKKLSQLYVGATWRVSTSTTENRGFAPCLSVLKLNLLSSDYL